MKKNFNFWWNWVLRICNCSKIKTKKIDVTVATRKSIKTKYKNFKLIRYTNSNINLILKDIDYVICANGPSRDSFTKNKDKILKNYIKEMNNIFINCQKNNIKKIIYLSSIHVLTNFQNINDDLKYYIESKKKIETIIKKLFSKNYKQIKILRLTNIFGYYDKKDYVKSFSLVKDFVYQAKKTNQIIIESEINFKRIFFPMNLFLEYLIFFIENNTNKLIYNIGDLKYELSLLELANKIKKNIFKKNKKNKKILYSFKKEIKRKKQIFSFFLTKKIKNNSNFFDNQISKLI